MFLGCKEQESEAPKPFQYFWLNPSRTVSSVTTAGSSLLNPGMLAESDPFHPHGCRPLAINLLIVRLPHPPSYILCGIVTLTEHIDVK